MLMSNGSLSRWTICGVVTMGICAVGCERSRGIRQLHVVITDVYEGEVVLKNVRGSRQPVEMASEKYLLTVNPRRITEFDDAKLGRDYQISAEFATGEPIETIRAADEARYYMSGLNRSSDNTIRFNVKLKAGD